MFTGFYGHLNIINIRFSWEWLNRIKLGERTPWYVAGDFNEILVLREKVGGKVRAEHQLTRFRGAVSNNLFDAGYVGNLITWSIRHSDHTYTKERLDRYLPNAKWKSRFKVVLVEGLVARSSNHKPIMLSVMESDKMLSRRRYVFKFEASWLKEEECKDMGDKTCLKGYSVISLWRKSEALKHMQWHSS